MSTRRIILRAIPKMAAVLLSLLLSATLPACGDITLTDGAYECVVGDDSTCPPGWACRYVDELSEARCFAPIGTCGNGILEGTEQCDGEDTGGASCSTIGYSGGYLTCTADCEHDVEYCYGPTCALLCTEPGHICVGSTPQTQTCVPACNADQTCDDGTLTCCDGGCVDVANDPNNCNGCGVHCEGTCINTVCVDACGNTCTETSTCCSGSCYNLSIDPDHCGDCDTDCDPLISDGCVDGLCWCGGTIACPTDSQCCNGACKYISIEVANCGGCGVECGIGESCAGGDCRCGSGAGCDPGYGCCGGTCVDLTTTTDCGTCNNTCEPHERCESGTCQGWCGNGVLDTGEVCDDTDFGGATCADYGFNAGSLVCGMPPILVNCNIIDDDGCYHTDCGNGIVDAGEDCDGTALDGASCSSHGYIGGVLQCTTGCAYDPSGCTAPVCGNGIDEPGEDCDGTDLVGASCASIGYLGGVLQCAGNCSFETAGCTPPVCGNNVVEPGEDCDGTDLAGKSCADVGFFSGILTCEATCLFDTSACFGPELCSNGIDDDGDGLCDCGDVLDCLVHCIGFPQQETNCTNGTDDDGDCVTDCADPDCAADPACSASNPCVPNPCTNPPQDSCTGDVAYTYASPGSCTDVGGSPDCDYPPTTEDCTLTGQACVGGACVPAGGSSLIISEYVEGSSFNKYLELYNATAAPVDLGQYRIELYFNGLTSIGGTINLTSTILASGDTYVIADDGHSLWMSPGPDEMFTSASWNGNDVVRLVDVSTNQIDIIGVLGDATYFGQDMTLVRNSGVTTGVTGASWNPAQWTQLAQDTHQLGSHTP